MRLALIASLLVGSLYAEEENILPAPIVLDVPEEAPPVAEASFVAAQLDPAASVQEAAPRLQTKRGCKNCKPKKKKKQMVLEADAQADASVAK